MHSNSLVEWVVFRNAAQLAMSEAYALDIAAARRSISIVGSAALGISSPIADHINDGELTHNQWICPLGQGAKMKMNKKNDPFTKFMEELQHDPRWVTYMPLENDWDFFSWADGFLERWYCKPTQYIVRYSKKAKQYNLFYRDYKELQERDYHNYQQRNHDGKPVHNRHFLLSCPEVTRHKHNTCLIIRSFASGVEWVKEIAKTQDDILQQGNSNMFETACFIHEASRLSGISADILRNMYIDLGGTPMAKMNTPKEILAAAQIAVRR